MAPDTKCQRDDVTDVPAEIAKDPDGESKTSAVPGLLQDQEMAAVAPLVGSQGAPLPAGGPTPRVRPAQAPPDEGFFNSSTVKSVLRGLALYAGIQFLMGRAFPPRRSSWTG
jgi:hypothetical protein